MLKVLDYFWHPAHAWELYKLPFAWHVLPGDWWGFMRPYPQQVTPVNSDVDPRGFDLIICHLSHEGCGYFDRLRQYADRVPVIAICHGVPTGAEQVAAYREMVGEIFVVCNAEPQEREWGFKRSKTILHGFSPEEWPATDYARSQAVVSLPGIGADYPHFGHNYGISTLDAVRQRVPVTWIRKDIGFNSWNDYRAYLAHASIYFNPTRRSPNPRARGEAAMMGLVPVTTAFMGEEQWIDDGYNGYLVPDNAEIAADVLYGLINDPAKCREVGARARETALECFPWSKWAAEWLEVIEQERARYRNAA